MVIQQANLEVDADVDGDGSSETGRFEFRGNLEVVPTIRTGFLVGGAGSTVNAIFSETFGEGEEKRKGVHLDLGGGTRAVEIQFTSWEGSPDRWGATGGGLNATGTDATGASPLAQMDVLMQYMAIGEVDSRNPARLEYGLHGPGEPFDTLKVVMEQPRLSASSEDGPWFTGSMTFLSTVDLNETLDGIQQNLE